MCFSMSISTATPAAALEHHIRLAGPDLQQDYSCHVTHAAFQRHWSTRTGPPSLNLSGTTGGCLLRTANTLPGVMKNAPLLLTLPLFRDAMRVSPWPSARQLSKILTVRTARM